VELKHATEKAKIEARYSFQSNQSGIETKTLKSKTKEAAAFQSNQSGIETS